MKVLLSLLLSLMVLSACSNPIESEEKKCPCYVKIPQLQEDGSYKLEAVQIKTLDSIKKIKSSKIQVTMNPRFLRDGTVEDLQPEAQFMITKDNVIVPTRTETAEMFSIYKIMEDLYFFDRDLGISSVLKYPLHVSLQTRASRQRSAENNATYLPYFDHITVWKYVGDLVPLGLNRGVLAHEHFHALFSNIVHPDRYTVKSDAQGLADDEQEGQYTFIDIFHDSDTDSEAGYNFLILKALDEGLADFWANLFTDLENPYMASFDSDSAMSYRSIKPIVNQMESQEELTKIFNFNDYKQENAVNSENDKRVHAYVYGRGVWYSNLFKAMSLKITADETDPKMKKIIIGQWIISSIKKLARVVQEKGQTEIITQADILNNFVPESVDKSIESDVCLDLNVFLNFNSKAPACSRQ